MTSGNALDPKKLIVQALLNFLIKFVDLVCRLLAKAIPANTSADS